MPERLKSRQRVVGFTTISALLWSCLRITACADARVLVLVLPSQRCVQGASGVNTYPIEGPVGVVGSAYLFMSNTRVLYITLQFLCSYMFSTEPT